MENNKLPIEEIIKLWPRCESDFPFYAEKFLFIQDKYGGVIPFKLNRCQLKIWGFIKEDIKNRKPSRLIILKARQMGISTLIQALIFWYITFNENMGSLVVAHSQDSSEALFNKQKLFYKCLPDLCRPMTKKSNRKELYFANPDDKGERGLESRVLVNTAENAEVGRSFTLFLVHLSEFAFWESKGYEPKERLIALLQAIPDNVWTFLGIESTACGEGYFKGLWDDDENSYRKIFLSWIADDTYRLPIEEEDYFKLTETDESLFGDEVLEAGYIADQIRFWYEEIESEDDLISEIMARLNWRRYIIINKCEKDWRKFQQEYPTIPEQAFVASGSNIFNASSLNLMLKNAKTPRYFKFDFDFAVNDLKDLLEKTDKEQRERVAEYFQESEIKRAISLYELPSVNKKYVIGADAAEGVQGADHSSIVVLSCNDMEEVFSYDGIIPPEKFAYLLNAVGILYHGCLIGVESNDKGGGTVNHLLNRKLHYSNIYFRQKFNTIKQYKRVDDYGWKTTAASKNLLVSMMFTFIDNEDINFHSPELIKQLKLFKLFEDDTMGVEPPEHDDFAIASMISLQMCLVSPVKPVKPEVVKNRGVTIKKLLESLDNQQRIENSRINGSIRYGY